MWFQKPLYDVYVYAQISKDDKYLNIKSWTTKEIMKQKIESGEIEVVKRASLSRQDYIMNPNKMFNSWFGLILK